MLEEFIDTDVRKTRQHLPVNVESVTKKLNAMLPRSLVDGSTILDLGCATGSAGYWCKLNNAKSYTGIELQDNYYRTAKQLLPECEIIQADVIEFLKTTDRTWEVVVAAGLLHGIFNPFEIISLINKVATDYIVIENNETVENGIPSIHFRKTNMVNDIDMNNPYHGYATYIGSGALEFIMNEYGWVGERIIPDKISSGIDPYHTKSKHHDSLPEHVHRYVYIFKRKETTKQSLENLVRNDNVGIQ
jgi:predicted RNA methylase